MTYKITHKNSTVSGTPPTAGDIDVGEIAINAADAELYTKDANGNIKKFANTDTTGTAAGVQFTQTGTGAVQRTVESKLQDVVSVLDFIPESEHAAIKAGTSTYNATAAIQAAINAFPSNTIIDGGGGFYKVSATIRIPNNSRFLTIRGLNIGAVGDITVLSSNAITDLVSFFSLENLLIDVSGHTTVGRRAIDFSCFSISAFRDVWVYGATGKTIAFYGTCTNGGSGPYYNVWDKCYAGAIRAGIVVEDAAGTPQTGNSSTITNCRFQPGSDNFGIYIGNNNQNWRITNNVFESVGGTGIYMGGHACLITGNRFESMTTGIAYTSGCFGNLESGNYFDSNGSNRLLPGNAIYQNTVLISSTTTTGVTNSLHGNTGHYSTGSQNTVSAFGKDLGTNNSTYTSDTNLAASTDWRHFSGFHSTGGSVSYIVYGNGNVLNTNNSYGAISDLKLKENIVNASSQWEDIKSLRIRKYNFKSETNHQTHTQIGLIAQEVELVSPGLVNELPDLDNEGNSLGTSTKSVNYSVLYLKAVKALQEAIERIEALESDLATLKTLP